MPENTTAPVNTRRSYVKIFLTVLILLLVYGAGTIVLPFSIQTSFWNKNCNSVLTLHKSYASLYPEFIRVGTLSGPVRECEAYMLATSNEEDKNWRDAYDAYQVYSTTYPSGLYVVEAYEHSAVALANIAKEQVERKEYEDAVKNLNLITSSYSDADISVEVWTLLPSIYTSWGADMRESGDFAKAEQVLNDFKNWSLTYQRNDSVIDAQRELAKTYLAWSRDLQSQMQYEDALAKLDLAVSADPESQFDSAAQVKSGQSHVYMEWGNDLLEQDQFPLAIEKFELAVVKAEGTKDDSARDALANGQVQWAHKLSADEDFQDALEHMAAAKEIAASDTANKSVDTALQDTYLAFSNSTGQQARRAIKEALQTVCEKHQAPDLPIFGLNKNSIRFGIYGAEDPLPEELAIRAPGEMHYVACITADNKTIESRLHRNITLRVASNYYYYTLVEQFRVQVIWNVELIKVDTGTSVAEQTLKGAPPPPFSEAGGIYFYGLPPLDEFTVWLQSFLP